MKSSMITVNVLVFFQMEIGLSGQNGQVVQQIAVEAVLEFEQEFATTQVVTVNKYVLALEKQQQIMIHATCRIVLVRVLCSDNSFLRMCSTND